MERNIWMVEVREANSTKEKKAFVKFPLELYKDCPQFVPFLLSDELDNFNPKRKIQRLIFAKPKCFWHIVMAGLLGVSVLLSAMLPIKSGAQAEFGLHVWISLMITRLAKHYSTLLSRGAREGLARDPWADGL